jgi:hypothetical protein
MFFGIDHDWGSVGAANSVTARLASGKSACEEIARNFAGTFKTKK